MEDAATLLHRLGMSKHTDRFLLEGFDTWDVIRDITEADLAFLDVCMACRKRLQQEILATWHPRDPCCLSSPNNNPHFKKRKYRRRPRIDSHAPTRPFSAYVLFSNSIRKKLEPKQLSFIEQARDIGKRWRLLGTKEKAGLMLQVAIQKEHYEQKFVIYKKTKEYSDYRIYLEDFKAQFSNPRRRAEQELSSQNRITTIDEWPKSESTVCVDSVTDHKHVDGLALSIPPTFSSPRQPSELLVDIHTGEKSLQSMIASLVLRRSFAVEYTHGYLVDAAERSLKVPSGNGLDCRQYSASAPADHAMPLTGYDIVSTSFHGRLGFPDVSTDLIQASRLVIQQYRRLSSDHEMQLLPFPPLGHILRTANPALPTYFNVVLN